MKRVRVRVEWLQECMVGGSLAGPSEMAAALTEKGGFAACVADISPDANDAVLEIDIPSSRPDCFCIDGIAAEIRIALGLMAATQPGDAVAARVEDPHGSNTSGNPLFDEGRPIAVAEGQAIGRHLSVRVNLTSGSTASGLDDATRRMFHRVGTTLGAANAAYEFAEHTNRPARFATTATTATTLPLWSILADYVTLQTGIPCLAYEIADLAYDDLVLREATLGERLRLSDGREWRLTPGDPVLSYRRQVIGIPGVVAGQHRAKRKDAMLLMFELARIDCARAESVVRRLPIVSWQGERAALGPDVNRMLRARDFLVQTLASVSRPERMVVGDYFPVPLPPRLIALRVREVARLLGREIALAPVIAALAGRGIAVKDASGDRTLFAVPTERVDLEREIDLIHEYVRTAGMASIAETELRLYRPPA